MASDISTIQSLKAVDAWIDVINANINGGVRTAFKASRLKFAGSNTNVDRPGTTTSLPLQFPEPSLVTSNTVIDFTQGAVTASTENSHLAIQGTGWYMVMDSGSISAGGGVNITSTSRCFMTRDGEFRTNQQGLLVNSSGYYLVTGGISATNSVLDQNRMRTVYNNLDSTNVATGLSNSVNLSEFITNTFTSVTATGGSTSLGIGLSAGAGSSIVKVTLGQQSLQYTQFGSTVFNFGFVSSTLVASAASFSTQIKVEQATTSDATILNKSLEASNASMTQSVPELSLAQKLFSALTKVFQTKQTNIDGVINLIR